MDKITQLKEQIDRLSVRIAHLQKDKATFQKQLFDLQIENMRIDAQLVHIVMVQDGQKNIGKRWTIGDAMTELKVRIGYIEDVISPVSFVGKTAITSGGLTEVYLEEVFDPTLIEGQD